MANYNNKFDPKNAVNAGFVLQNGAIVPVTVTNVEVDDSASAVTITNSGTLPDGSSGKWDESEIFLAPTDLVNALLAAYEAAYPPAANSGTAPSTTATGTAPSTGS